MSTCASTGSGGTYVIGKIPGYNSNIDPNNKYRAKLLDNMSIVKMTPTGYKLNTSLLDLGKNSNSNSGTLFEIIKTEQALGSWKKILLNNKKTLFSDDNDITNTEQITIISTGDSTINESISSSFSMNTIEKFKGAIGGKTAVVSKLADTVNSTNSNKMRDLIMAFGEGTSQQGLDFLLGSAAGMGLSLPQEWKSSDYSSSMSLMIKLISPYGDPESINNYIIKPLMLLTLASSPITATGVSYGFPFLWKIQAPGVLDMKLAYIQNMNIVRGGQDQQFSIYKQPLSVDVRITLVPLTQGFASIVSPDKIDLNNISLNTPQDIYKSLMVKDEFTNDFDSFLKDTYGSSKGTNVREIRL